MIITETSKDRKRIERIEVTNDLLTSRAGLAPLAEFVRKSGMLQTLAALNPVKKSGKGASDIDTYLQILLNFMDGTNTSLTGFDALRDDPAWADCCGVAQEDAVSSHSVKRFVGTMPRNAARKIRRLMLSVFKKALKVQKPEAIVLDVDTVVYDNDTGANLNSGKRGLTKSANLQRPTVRLAHKLSGKSIVHHRQTSIQGILVVLFLPAHAISFESLSNNQLARALN